MSYTINRTDGTTLVPGGLSDGTVDTSHTSLTLIGKDYAGYGQFLNENFVYLLENFASTSSPANPMTGQLWWDKTNNILKVWSGSSWKISTGATSSPFSAPPGDLSSLGGDLWWDTTNSQLKVYSGTNWVTVGPQATSVLQTTGAFAATIPDTSAASHKVIQIQFNGVVYAIFAYETFDTSIPGFTNIRAGINFSSIASPNWQLSNQSILSTPNTLVQRDGTGAINATTVAATTVNATTITATSAINGSFTGNLTGNVSATNITSSSITTQGITASSGFSGPVLTASQTAITGLGTLTGLQVGTLGSGAITRLYGTATLNDVAIATIGGSASFSSINGTTIGDVTPAAGTFTTLGVRTSAVPSSNLVVNLGSTSNYWNAFYTNTASVIGTVTGGNFLFSNGVSVVSAALSAVSGTMTINGTTISLGGSGTVTAAAGTLTGSTLNSTVTASSLTSVGTLTGLSVSGTGSLNKLSVYGGGSGVNTSSALNVSGDITVARNGATSATAGLIYFGTNGTNYIHEDGTNFNFTSPIVPSVTNTLTLGTTSKIWSSVYATTFYGTATQAQYADLAERFESDAEYPTGTVVELGGTKEITVSTTPCSENVFGVISTDPAYLMNSEAGTNVTHPPVALNGRVPVRVIGVINKGDRLVSAGNGMARAALREELTPFNVIGRALENKTDTAEGVIEAIVKTN